MLELWPFTEDEELHGPPDPLTAGEVDQELLALSFDDYPFHERETPPQFPGQAFHERLHGPQGPLLAIDIRRGQHHRGFHIHKTGQTPPTPMGSSALLVMY